MADEQPSLHIDTDWKRQAQEEKRRLAEQEAQRRASEQPPIAATAPAPTAPGAAAPSSRRGAPTTEPTSPLATFTVLVQSIVTQVLFYLGDLAPRSGQPTVNLDLAKHNVDMLAVLEQKTKGNLTPEEQHTLDSALYEARMRYVSVASQYATV